MTVLKEDLRKLYETKKQNSDRKSGISTEKLKELENKKKDIIKQRDKNQTEKEYVQRKVSNLKGSVVSKSPLSKRTNDGLEDISLLCVNINKTNTEKYRLENIDSEFDVRSFKEEQLSDCTSNASVSMISDSGRTELKKEISAINKDVLESTDPKVIYKEFVKIFLKVKFETIHSEHRGQQIHQNLIYREALKKNIIPGEWETFIIEELKNISKYERMKKSKSQTRL